MEAPPAEGGHKRSRCSSGEPNLNLSFDPALLNDSASSDLQTPTDPQNLSCVQDALSNDLVLLKMFTFLDDRDLVSCSNVSQYWRTVADPFVLSYYDIKLDTVSVLRNLPHNLDSVPESELPLYWKGPHRHRYRHSCNIVKVRERARYNRNAIFTEYESYHSGITQKLEKVLLTQKIAISLKISSAVDMRDGEVLNFLSKFGFLVLDLSLDCIKMNVVDLCKLLVRNFPNLSKLNYNGLHVRFPEVSIEDQFFNPGLPQNKHKQLRKISFGHDHHYNHSSIETIFEICENLEEIQNFPLQFINSIVITQRGAALKSLTGFWEDRWSVETTYEKLAQLQPKLTSLEVHPQRDQPFKRIKPHLFSVLRSSHESLQALIIPPIKPEDASNFPALKGLKTLELHQFSPNDEPFFPPNMPLRERFPHVSKICIPEKGMAYIKQNFPENIISSWGSQISQLRVGLLDPTRIPLLQRLFPCIQELTLKCTVTQVSNNLQELSRSWPQLKLLSICVGKNCHETRTMKEGMPLRLDHAFTGLPEEVIDQLEDPSRKKHFTQEEIQRFKGESIILKLKELQKLKLVVGDCQYHIGSQITSTYMQLTPVAHEFGFSLLPELKVTVEISEHAKHSEAIAKDLEPLARCSNMEIAEEFTDW